MSYTWRLWIGFALVLSVLLTTTACLSLTALRLGHAEAAASRQAAVEEQMRLALWRMDSALAPLLAQENAHPDYHNVDSSRTIEARGGNPHGEPATRVVGNTDHYVLLRFQFAVDRSNVPSPDFEADASLAATANEWSQRTELFSATPNVKTHLAELRERIPHQQLLTKLAESVGRRVTPQPLDSRPTAEVPSLAGGNNTTGSRAAVEFQQRNQWLMSNNAMAQQLTSLEHTGPDLTAVMMTPLWSGSEMLLARRMQRGNVEYVQGCLIDWQEMQGWLLELVADLLPKAELEPVDTFDPAGEPGLLAALPVRLVPGSLPAWVEPRRSVVHQTLILAWVAVLLASLVGAVLLGGVVRLSQRRGAFVAAVTHELRTPLTTFRMYSEMLAQGMVRDATTQREYLQTLRDQSLRLSHLVENVLAYARLERGRGLTPAEETSLSRLLAPLLPSLEQLAAREQMELSIERSDAFDVVLLANKSAVEQIMINLIDNACKYAGGSADRRIRLAAYQQGRFVVLRIRDYGPGLPHKPKWFRAFGKTAEEAAHSSPGIGLGLALSQRLTEHMGGRLEIDPTITDGAAFLLHLKRAVTIQMPDRRPSSQKTASKAPGDAG